MTRVLLAEDHPDTRSLLAAILGDAGYEVIEAKDGGIAFERACVENPDLILLDVSMPVMDGWEVLNKLRENSGTRETPVIMVTALRLSRGELPAWRLGVSHYIAKPFTTEQVLLTVRVALREAEGASAEPEPEEDSGSERRTVVGTGSQPLDQILGGGIALGSLTLIEGTPKSGKSVLCQYIAHESLLDGHGVTYFVSDDAAEDLIPQMSSIGLAASDYQRGDKLHIYTLKEPSLVDGPDCVYTPDQLMSTLAQEMEELSDEHPVIVVDAITTLASESKDRSTLRFFSACRRLSDEGRTIIMAAQPHAFDERLRARLRDLCDTYMKLRVENLGTKRGTALEVTKADKVEMSNGNTISFEVLSGVGMQTLAFSKFRA